MKKSLDAVDYVIFALFLVLSSAIGVYHGFRSKQASTRDYVLASQNVSWFPIFVSLLATFLSAISLLGIPSEVYTFGVEYIIITVSYPIMIALCAVVYAPIFYRMQLTSVTEYLERRFSSGVRLIGTCQILMQTIIYLSIVLYAPSLALEAVANVPLAASIVSTGLVCNFYTTLGGMKAVIWTDVFQAFMMLLGLIVVIVVGSNEVGGLGSVIEKAKHGNRFTFFDFDFDPTQRNTFWSLAIGGLFTTLPAWSVNQSMVQRILSAKSIRHAQWALYANMIGLSAIVSLCVLSGLVAYAVYAECDLKTVKEITSNDQILAYFIVTKLGNIKGIAGIFTACLFSGALSSASSGLNAMAAIFVDDIVRKLRPTLSDASAAKMMKITACTIGFITIGGAFSIRHLGTTVLQLGYSLLGIIGSPNLAMFTLGMISSRSNKEGVIVGVVAGTTVILWLTLGSISYPPFTNPAPVSIKGCQETLNIMINSTGQEKSVIRAYQAPLAKFYGVSYLWYALISFATTLLVGYTASIVVNCIRRQETKEVDPELLFHRQQIWQPDSVFSPEKIRNDVSDQTSDQEMEEKPLV